MGSSDTATTHPRYSEASRSVDHKNQICYPVCNKLIIIYLRETWIIHFRVTQAWALHGIP